MRFSPSMARCSRGWLMVKQSLSSRTSSMEQCLFILREDLHLNFLHLARGLYTESTKIFLTQTSKNISLCLLQEISKSVLWRAWDPGGVTSNIWWQLLTICEHCGSSVLCTKTVENSKICSNHIITIFNGSVQNIILTFFMNSRSWMSTVFWMCHFKSLVIVLNCIF